MEPRNIAEKALHLMTETGFDDAQVSAVVRVQDEINIAHDEPSMMRSTEKHELSLSGLLDGRKARTELADTAEESIREATRRLFEAAQVAPRDDANAVSSRQRADIVHGPQEGNAGLLAASVSELLAYRARETPRVHIEEGFSAYLHSVRHTITSRGSALSSRTGHYGLSAMVIAKDGAHTSSMNYTFGCTNGLGETDVASLFGIGEMMTRTQQQMHTQSLDGSFVGDVVLTPMAVGSLLRWLLEQVSDFQLIADRSMYRRQVGEVIASPLLSVRSRFDAPGTVALTDDGFVAEPLALVSEGRLMTLLPSLYGSRKTGIAHVPSARDGWRIDGGSDSRDELIGGVTRGALVGRLSMGRPAANGDFAGIIKNSFLIHNGERGSALAEVMISGNVARMLQDIVAISRERIDTGHTLLPWIRVADLHFS